MISRIVPLYDQLLVFVSVAYAVTTGNFLPWCHLDLEVTAAGIPFDVSVLLAYYKLEAGTGSKLLWRTTRMTGLPKKLFKTKVILSLFYSHWSYS